MALIFCYECGKKISDQAKSCPHCGAPLKVTKEYFNNLFISKIVLYPLIITLLIIGFLFVNRFTPQMLISETKEKVQNIIENYIPKPLYFRGTLDQEEIRMILYRSKNDLKGFYYFSEENKPQNNFSVTGSIINNHSLVLKDDENNVITAMWDNNTTMVTIDGKFKPNTKKIPSKKLQLIQEPIYLKNDQKIQTYKLCEDYKKKNMHVLISLEYPVIPNTAISNKDKIHDFLHLNEMIKAFKTDIENTSIGAIEFDKTLIIEPSILMTYAIKYHDVNYTSIAFNFNFDDGMQATVNESLVVMNVKNSTGEILQLQDFFQDKSYLNTISKYVRDHLRSDHLIMEDELKDDFPFKNTAPNEKNFEKWTLTPEGIEVYFDTYTLGCHADGIVHIVVPYKAFGNKLKLTQLKK